MMTQLERWIEQRRWVRARLRSTLLEAYVREMIEYIDGDEEIRLYGAARPYLAIKELLGIPR